MQGKSKKNKTIKWVVVVVIVVVVLFFLFHKKSSPVVADNNTLRVAVMGEPASLDPNLINGTWEAHVVVDLFVGLTVLSPNGEVLPAVATSWNISKDGKQYTFHLRKDDKWSDGVPVTAYDFVFGMKRELNPQTAAAYASLLYVIKGGEAYNTGKGTADDVGVTALDDYTLQIKLVNPTSYFLDMLTHQAFLPLPEHTVKKYGNAWSRAGNMVSNGAYKLIEWQPKSYIKVVKNDNFYDAKEVKIQNIVYYTQEDEDAILKRYRAGEIDWITLFGSTQYDWLSNNMKSETRVAPYAGVYYYAVNLNNPKFKNPKIRLALNLAVDRKFMTTKILKAGEVPAYNFIPPMKDYSPFVPNWSKQDITKRREEAKKLLAEAGYNEKHPLELTIAYNTSKDNKDIAVAVAAMWNRIGVKTSLYNKEVAVHYADLRAGNFDIGRAAWVADYVDPSNFLQILLGNSGNNNSGYHDAQFEKYYNMALSAKSKAEREHYYYLSEKLFVENDSVIPVFFYVSRNVVSSKIKGWQTNANDIHLARYLSLSE